MKTRLVQFVTGMMAAAAISWSGAANAECNNGSYNDCCCDYSGSVFAELLVWDICGENVWAQTTSGTTTTSHQIDYDYELGFRLGGVWNATDDWDLEVVYTWYENDQSASASTTYDSAFFTANPTSGSTRVDFEYNTLDILIGKKCCICEDMVIRPFIGFRGAWVDQEINETPAVGGGFIANDKGHWKSEVDAYGLRSGLDFEWCAFCNLTLVGKFGGSLFYTEEDVRRTVIENGVTSSFKTNECCTALFNYDTSVALDYEDCVCDWNYGLRLGYEFNHYVHLENYYSTQDSVSLHGVFLQGRLEF
jgi:hypothetical protein